MSMTEEEKYRRKAGLLGRAIRFADRLDQVETESGGAKASAGRRKDDPRGESRSVTRR